jgi:hypothetical protein
MLLNIFPTPEPNSAMTISTTMATRTINNAYSTSPWPFEEEKIMNALNNPEKPNNETSIDNPLTNAIALRSQGAPRS